MAGPINPYASPEAEPTLAPAGTPIEPAPRGAVWIPRGMGFPDRCVKCNADAGGYQLVQGVSWWPGWVFWLLLLGLVPCLVVMMLTSKQASFRIGLCPQHRRARRRTQVACCVASALFVVGVGVAILLPSLPLGIGCVVGVLGALIALARGVTVITAAKITDDAVAVRGLGDAFVESIR